MTHAGEKILFGSVGVLSVEKRVLEHLLPADVLGLVGDGDDIADNFVIDNFRKALHQDPAGFA